MLRDDDRRRYGRIELDEPLPGAIGETPISVIEISIGGFRVAHDTRFQPGQPAVLNFTWSNRPLRFGCHIVRSTLFRISMSAGQPSIYHSGVSVDESYEDSDRVLREIIGERVMRALEEQKANARGLPPVSAWMVEVQKSDRLRRYEFSDGVWRKLDTRDPKQPQNGFTVAATIDPKHAEMLCRAYESAGEEGRRLTRMLAELSISKKEGTPVRRYFP
jgi:hypothetical protein